MKQEIFPDFEDILSFLNKSKVEYIVIGGYAVSFHSQPKYTKDLDIWVNPTQINSEKIINVLKEFGFDNPALSKNDFVKEGNFIQLGYPPLRIDFITSLERIDFDNAYQNIVLGRYGRVENVPYLSLNDLIKNKKLTSRESDKYDLKWLKKYNG